MYHYVRDLPNTPWPRIKGLLTSAFAGQLDYLQRHYEVVDIQYVIDAARSGASLPSNAALLTFDDGFAEHADIVTPMLVERGLTASFYAPVVSARERRVLGVHKIHFILASVDHVSPVRDALFEELARQRTQGVELPTDAELIVTWQTTKKRYDPPEVVFVKRVLQRGLPSGVREQVIDVLFRRFVTRDERAFADELYASMDDLSAMIGAGMTIGGHGHRHRWLDSLCVEEQRSEIHHTAAFLDELYGGDCGDWVMCYPYGGYNDDTLRLCAERGCALGLTTRVGLASFERPLEIERLDTNDLPTTGSAPVSEWTRRALQM